MFCFISVDLSASVFPENKSEYPKRWLNARQLFVFVSIVVWARCMACVKWWHPLISVHLYKRVKTCLLYLNELILKSDISFMFKWLNTLTCTAMDFSRSSNSTPLFKWTTTRYRHTSFRAHRSNTTKNVNQHTQEVGKYVSNVTTR